MLTRFLCALAIFAGSAYPFTDIPITNLSPASNLLPPGTTTVDLTFNTLQPASCAYSIGSQLPFASMSAIAGGQKTMAHRGTIGGLSSSPLVLNTVYLQCDSNPDFVQTLKYRVVGSGSGAFPRIGSIWEGEYILTTKPDQAAKIQVYFGPGGMTASQAIALRAQNPNVLILPSVNAQETTGGSPAAPADYLLKDVSGNTIEDWPGNFLLNLTKPEVAAFLAQYAFDRYFTQANLAFDGLFWDNFHTTIPNVFYDYRGVPHQVDANGDGLPDDQNTLNAAWSQGMYSLISAFNQLAPFAYTAGHIDQRPPSALALANFNGDSFTEDAPHVREGTASFNTMMDSYNAWFAGGRQPAIATIQSAPPSQIAYGYGYQPLQHVTPGTIQFSQTFYPNMRFGLATALMNDGFSVFDFGDSGAPVNWWYDEFDFNLGYPIGPATKVGSGSHVNMLANSGFEAGLSGWSLLVSNDGQAAATAARDATIAADGTASAVLHVASPGTINWHIDFEQNGLPLVAGTSYQVQFWARSDSPRTITVFTQGGAPNYPYYGLTAQPSLSTTWRFFTASFVAPATAHDGRLEFWVGDQAGSVWLDDIALFPAMDNTYRRDYSNGAVLLNGTPIRQTIPVESGFTRFSGSQAPLWQYIVDDSAAGFAADSSWQTVTYDTGLYSAGNYAPPFYHAWNGTAHLQNTSGTAAQWSLDIPADGQYTIQVWLPAAPGASTWTKNAVYEVVSNGVVVATSTLDQTAATAGDAWHAVATVSLTSAGAPVVRVHNSGTGALIADAVYVTSAALFNDGSPVSQVTLGPYDGILLRRLQPVPAPTTRVNAVSSAASYQTAISSSGWVSLYGVGLSTTTRSWAAADFTGSNLPTSLDGVSVTVNGIPAYIYYISPTQINALAPADSAIGPVTVQVSSPQGVSYPAVATKQKLAPAFFVSTQDGVSYAAAVHIDGSYVGPAGPGSRPAAAGETIQIYGTGFGDTVPALSPAQLVAEAAPLVLPVAITVGGTQANVLYAGLVGSGLYQFNVTLPGNLPAGNQPIQASAGGFETPVVFLPVQPR